MGVHEHRRDAPMCVKIAFLTISDSRTLETDTAGKLGCALIEAAGHELCGYRIVHDEPREVRAQIEMFCGIGAQAIVTAGGTGFASRDHSYETIHRLFEKELVGFGELFRMLSFEEIGAASMLSRATAGIHHGVAIFSCPGSEAAVRLALEKLILPEVGHVVAEASR